MAEHRAVQGDDAKIRIGDVEPDRNLSPKSGP
jgi:hypothetical protein